MVYVLLIKEKGLAAKNAWYKWLELELDKRGHILLTADFPDNENVENWRKLISEHFKFLDGESMLIGHGFGVKVALKVLENKTRTVAATFLVAGHLEDEQYDFSNIKTKSREFFVYAGADDEIVHPDAVEHLALLLDEDVLLIQDAGHFDKINEFEDLLIDIISVLDQ